MTRLLPGDPAPALPAVDADGAPISIDDCAGGSIILYFFPAAMTPGCTLEALDFNAAVDQLAADGYTVIGVSPDPPAKLIRFRQTKNLHFRLAPDPEKTLAKAYGVWGVKALYGKQVEGILRSTFVIDIDDSRPTIRLAQYNVRSKGHVERLLRELRQAGR
ncbi:MAG: peroxiredoxin [Propionibacteriaceae bacterium]|jgi:peroxiredoxin Q/BCP|nr:peroxiredoxin [Propionibacteriaceae bacterium]